MKRRHFAQFLFAGSFVSETAEHAVEVRDPYAVEWPARAYAVRFVDRWVSQAPDKTELQSEPTNRSGLFIKGEAKSLDEVEAMAEGDPARYRILLDNMRCNGWGHVVKCAQGYLPLHPGDEVIA